MSQPAATSRWQVIPPGLDTPRRPQPGRDPSSTADEAPESTAPSIRTLRRHQDDRTDGGSMADEEMGPVDYLVVEFPGNKMTGEGFPLLMDLVDRGIIRILDFLFVRKESDGSVTA